MRSAVFAILVACGGGNQPVAQGDRVARPRANAPWVAEGGCLPKKTQDLNCVTVTIADAARIREALIAYLAQIKDLPDKNLASRLAETPIAQWTTLAYRFSATHSTGVGSDNVEIEAFEAGYEMRTGFRAHVVRHDIGWMVHELVMFAEQLPQPL
jgi:hypothetical protein